MRRLRHNSTASDAIQTANLGLTVLVFGAIGFIGWRIWKFVEPFLRPLITDPLGQPVKGSGSEEAAGLFTDTKMISGPGAPSLTGEQANSQLFFNGQVVPIVGAIPEGSVVEVNSLVSIGWFITGSVRNEGLTTRWINADFTLREHYQFRPDKVWYRNIIGAPTLAVNEFAGVGINVIEEPLNIRSIPVDPGQEQFFSFGVVIDGPLAFNNPQADTWWRSTGTNVWAVVATIWEGDSPTAIDGEMIGVRIVDNALTTIYS